MQYQDHQLLKLQMKEVHKMELTILFLETQDSLSLKLKN